MKFRGLLIAVLVLLVLSGLLYWSNHRKPSEQSAAPLPPPSPAILKMERAAISQLTLARKSTAPVTLVKGSGDTWRITAPKPLNADQDTLSGLLSTVAALNADRVVEDKAADLKPYGLDQPSLTVDITSEGHAPRKLFLGDDTPAGSDVYAMLEGDPKIYTIASYNKTSIDKGLNDLRDKRLLTLEPDKINRVELDNKGQTIEFTRTKDGWQILKPRPLRADGSAVDNLVRAVSNARMTLDTTGDDHATDFAQATPVATVTLTGDQGAQTVNVRKKKNDYYAKSTVAEGAFKTDTSLGPAVDKNLDDFRNKKLFEFGFQDPNKIELHAGAKAWFFTRSGSDWWSNGKKMDSSGVDSLVDKLRDLTATSFPDSGFAAPIFEATITSNDGKRVEKVLISKSGDNYIAKRESEPALYQLNSSAVTDLTTAADATKPAATASK